MSLSSDPHGLYSHRHHSDTPHVGGSSQSSQSQTSTSILQRHIELALPDSPPPANCRHTVFTGNPIHTFSLTRCRGRYHSPVPRQMFTLLLIRSRIPRRLLPAQSGTLARGWRTRHDILISKTLTPCVPSVAARHTFAPPDSHHLYLFTTGSKVQARAREPSIFFLASPVLVFKLDFDFEVLRLFNSPSREYSGQGHRALCRRG